MTKSSELKQIARNKLSGNWAKAFAITAIYVAITIALSYISKLVENVTADTPILYYASKIIFALILLPTYFGYISTMVKLINGKKPAYTDLINDALLNGSKAIEIFFRILLKLLIPSILIVVITVAIFYLFFSNVELNFVTLIGFWLLLIFLYIVAAIVIAIIALPYSLAYYALANDTSLSAKAALEKSIALMAGNKWNFFKLLLSFIGWFLLLEIAFGISNKYSLTIFYDLIETISSIIILPYIISSIAIFYDELNDTKVEIVETKAEENKEIEQ